LIQLRIFDNFTGDSVRLKPAYLKIKLILSFGLLYLSSGIIAFAQDTLDVPIFSVTRGFYSEPFEVEISCPVAGALISYTLDCSDPRTSSDKITGTAPVTVSIDPESSSNRGGKTPGVVLRAYAHKEGYVLSQVMTHTYIFIESVKQQSAPGGNWPAGSVNGQRIDYEVDPDIVNDNRYKDLIDDALLAIPTFSIATEIENLFDPTTGIYVNALSHGIEWERPASVESIYPDGTKGFQINAGLRIRGGWSRHGDCPKHAFRLFFRTEYGAGKLCYPLFGDEGVDTFDKIDLRTSQNYSWSYKSDEGKYNTMNRDVFSRDIQHEMGAPYTRSRYYHLYLNGCYWGLFQTQERSEASYAAEYLGGDRDDYDVVKVDITNNNNIEATDGNLDAWREVWNLCQQGFDNDENYFKLQGCNSDGTKNPAYKNLVDIDNLIDYMLIIFYAGNFDSPVSAFGSNASPNNFFAIYNREDNEGFKFFIQDAEHTLLTDPVGPGHGLEENRVSLSMNITSFDKFHIQWLHYKLTSNANYRLRFADHVYLRFFVDGILAPAACTRRFEERANEIETAIIAESARWGDANVNPPRTKDDDWIPAINNIINNYFPYRTDIVLNQLQQAGLFSSSNTPNFNHKPGRVANGTTLRISAETGTIYYTTDGNDPRAPEGSQSETNTATPIAENADKYVLVPSQDIGTAWYSDYNYDVSNWGLCIGGYGGVGYEASSGYESYITYDVGDQMNNNDGSKPNANTSCYIRIPFTISTIELSDYNTMFLHLRYDDGFVIYLNGTKIASANAPDSPEWNSVANDYLESENEEIFNVSDYFSLLQDGENLLAIQLMNNSNTSSDLLLTLKMTISNAGSSGGVPSPTAAEYSAPIVINQTTTIKARSEFNGSWSPLSKIALYVLDGLANLRVTEINYHPLDSQDTTDSEYEFIELKNIGESTLDLTSVSFTAGVSYSFPSNTFLNSGEFIVLASNSEMFQKRYGFAPFGSYTGHLDNGGELIALSDGNNNTVLAINYSDDYPWPKSADGEGYSLTTKSLNPYEDQNNPFLWQASSVINGTPGRDDSLGFVNSILEKTIPRKFTLYQNYPNPFNPTTTLHFQIDQPGKVNLAVFNLLGQKVAQPVNDYYLPGDYRLQWNASDLATGVYFLRLQAGGHSEIKKILLLK
jgi:hypothetical protein